MKPSDFNVPENFQHWKGDRAEDTLGPFFFTVEEGVAQTAFRIESRHCNAHETLHGGILMAFADYSMCIAANGGAHESVVTVSCNNEFIAPAVAGELLLGEAEVIKRGRSLIFVRCELYVESPNNEGSESRDDRICLNSSGIIKRFRS